MSEERGKENQLVTLSEARTRMAGLLDKMKPQLADALAGTVDVDRFNRIALTALSNNPKLAMADPRSFIGAVVQIAQLGLEVDSVMGRAFLVPYTIKGKRIVQPQIGYKGFVTLMYRSQRVIGVQAEWVTEGDEFDYEQGTHGFIHHKPSKDRKLDDPILYTYCIVKINPGGFVFKVLNAAEIMQFKARSQAASKGFSPWNDPLSFPWMATKTAIRQVVRLAPVEAEALTAASLDERPEMGVQVNPADEVGLPDITVDYGDAENGDEVAVEDREESAFDEFTNDS